MRHAVLGLLCAWVLWEQFDRLPPSPYQLGSVWSLMMAHETRAGCQEALAAAVTAQRAQRLRRHVKTSDSMVSEATSDRWTEYTTWRYHCYPDTLDPRGPTR